MWNELNYADANISVEENIISLHYEYHYQVLLSDEDNWQLINNEKNNFKHKKLALSLNDMRTDIYESSYSQSIFYKKLRSLVESNFKLNRLNQGIIRNAKSLSFQNDDTDWYGILLGLKKNLELQFEDNNWLDSIFTHCTGENILKCTWGKSFYDLNGTCLNYESSLYTDNPYFEVYFDERKIGVIDSATWILLKLLDPTITLMKPFYDSINRQMFSPPSQEWLWYYFTDNLREKLKKNLNYEKDLFLKHKNCFGEKQSQIEYQKEWCDPNFISFANYDDILYLLKDHHVEKKSNNYNNYLSQLMKVPRLDITEKVAKVLNKNTKFKIRKKINSIDLNETVFNLGILLTTIGKKNNTENNYNSLFVKDTIILPPQLISSFGLRLINSLSIAIFTISIMSKFMRHKIIREKKQ